MARMDTGIGVWMILSSLAEGGDRDCPEGVLYMGLSHAGCGLDQFNALITVMNRRGWIDRVPPHQVRITDAGRRVAAKLDAALKPVLSGTRCSHAIAAEMPVALGNVLKPEDPQ